ncbi:hypothetical protein Glove_320g10 [Diversispora epigaea]|uniref:Uncharacterized protein n=1 Tax=Diversispora epigaea TaxID=1348612 RepID=A0A397HU52_9GLOM|nr:hypothetical protein Glove_320g10 [Diversispora epigaea]
MSCSTEESETNALIKRLQDAFRIRNDVKMLSFEGGNRDPMEWLEEFNRSARINQYTSEYKLQVVARYLQEVAIRIAKQFEENMQTYPEVTVRYGVTTYVNPQGFMPSCDQNRNRKDVIKRIVQKVLAPIVEKLQRITERDERPTHTFYRRPNYNNDIRGQNTWNRNNNVNDPFCYFSADNRNTWREVAQPQANVTMNQSMNQIPLNGANGNTFVTQQEEVKQLAVTTWETARHLNY